MPEQATIRRDDYPGLYQAADQASVDSQGAYLKAIRWYLACLVIAAALSVYADRSRWWALLAALLFLGTLGLLLLQGFRRFDRTWYNGRAVAESVKTRTWRFMMRAEPYADAESAHVVERAFCRDLEQILKQNRNLAPHIGGDFSLGDPITSRMKEVRGWDVPERLDLYRHERIDEQRQWYARKYGENRRGERLWFWTMITLHALAVGLLLVRVADPTSLRFPIEAVAVAAGSALTWMQVRRFQDNATAYSLAAHEIGFIRQQSASIDSENALSDFVKDAENAFSREHTQWQARRDT